MPTSIRTFNSREFLQRFMEPDPNVARILRAGVGPFFILPVQDMIRVSKVPVPPTRATSHTLIFLTSGEASLHCGFRDLRIGAGEALVVAAGQVFSYDRHEVNEGYLCNFHNDFLLGPVGSRELLHALNCLQVWGEPVLRPAPATARWLAATFAHLEALYREGGAAERLALQSGLLAALCALQGGAPPAVATNNSAGALVHRFQELLLQEAHHEHRVEAYAARLHVSARHLARTVSAVTGKPPSRWIDETIVSEAKILLARTDEPVGSIAAGLGVADASYFSRLFRRYAGCTPLAYRLMRHSSGNGPDPS